MPKAVELDRYPEPSEMICPESNMQKQRHDAPIPFRSSNPWDREEKRLMDEYRLELEIVARSGPFIVVPSDDDLRDKGFLRKLAVQFAAREIPRRKVAAWINETLKRYQGGFRYADGTPFVPGLADEAFAKADAPRWVSDFLRVAVTPWKQVPQTRVLPRLRLIAVCIAILGTPSLPAYRSKPGVKHHPLLRDLYPVYGFAALHKVQKRPSARLLLRMWLARDLAKLRFNVGF